VTLGDVMNQLADEAVAARVMPDPGQVRRTGDRLRQRSHRRAALAVAAAVVAVLAAGAIIYPGPQHSAQPIGPIDGWRVTRTLHVPRSGSIVYAADAVWAIDNMNLELVANGTVPAGEMYQIDPDSGHVLDRLPGAVGGWPSVGAGAIWLSTAAGDLNVLTKVDLASHEVTRFSTSLPRQLPRGSAVAAGSLWAANTDSGDLVRMDPQTYELLQTIHLGESDNGGAPISLMTDGKIVWASTGDGIVWRIDGATGERLSLLQLPLRDPRLVGIDPSRHTLYASSGNLLLEIDADQRSTDWAGRELRLAQTADRSLLAGLAVGPDALWAATLSPDEILRIDPDTFTITGRMPLAGADHESNVPVALATGGGATWIRIKGKVLELSPTDR
jgi:hypothetical protein